METIVPDHVFAAANEVFEKISSVMVAEQIYLLSFVHQRFELESAFVPSPAAEHVIEGMNILIIKSDSEKRDNEELQDLVENRLGLRIPLTAFIIEDRLFCRWLESGHPFARIVSHNCKIYYASGNILINRSELLVSGDQEELLKKDYQLNMQKAVEFAAGAELYILRKQFEIAAFHLHQATEQCYAGVIRFFTGLRTQTHNIDKLYRYSRYLLPGLKNVFPRDTEDERNLFRQLQKAYVGGRYSPDFLIRQDTISQLNERVGSLMRLCRSLPRAALHRV